MKSLPKPWNNDPPGSSARIRRNAARTLRLVKAHAQSGAPPTLLDVQQWHRELFQGVSLPVSYYAGEFRDSDPRFPELIDYNVDVGGVGGVPATEVPKALALFEQAMQQTVSSVDAGIGVTNTPKTVPELVSVAVLAANAHGEWVRIHPFANGNGRTARLWGNWALLRYGLPPIFRVKARPRGTPYGNAAAASMRSDHSLMTTYITNELNARI